MADDSGDFELELGAVDGPLTIVVTDVAGNTIEMEHHIAVVASRVEIDAIRTVHATFWAWATPSLREPILEMIDDGRINAVQLDLKDEGGHPGDDSQIPLAQEIGAAIGPLHLDIAEEAAAAGVDHILWDYIRRPEGLDNYTVPGLETTPEEAIVEFTRLADERLAPYGVQHGASVYGIAADRPTQIGQDIPAMARYLDYVAPMLYPSHWGPGEYDVSDPNRQPYDIIRATLEVWDETVAGRRARVVPWLEDTPYRAWDRPFQVREQIRAARDHGIDEWLMWNPGSTFTPAAYERLD